MRDLPWRHNRTPYRVWLSEIMLQQTQVATVIEYYLRFTSKYPTIKALAEADLDEVMGMWSGLGYYSRCRNLHKAANIVMDEFKGAFPTDIQLIQKLPGIGSYTAGAIFAFAFDKSAAVVDGNISRVLSRHFNDPAIINDAKGKKHYESINFNLVKDAKSPRLFQEGLMELGATICAPTDPKCAQCPIQKHCQGYASKTSSALPNKAPPIKKTEMHVACAIVTCGNKIWLEKREKGTLFKGLYEPPSAGDIRTLNQRLENLRLEAPPLPIDPTDCRPSPSKAEGKITRIKRTLTHRILHLEGHRLELDKPIPNVEWFDLDKLDEVGISKAMRTLLDACL